jgi:hypothetical protein
MVCHRTKAMEWRGRHLLTRHSADGPGSSAFAHVVHALWPNTDRGPQIAATGFSSIYVLSAYHGFGKHSE